MRYLPAAILMMAFCMPAHAQTAEETAEYLLYGRLSGPYRDGGEPCEKSIMGGTPYTVVNTCLRGDTTDVETLTFISDGKCGIKTVRTSQSTRAGDAPGREWRKSWAIDFSTVVWADMRVDADKIYIPNLTIKDERSANGHSAPPRLFESSVYRSHVDIQRYKRARDYFSVTYCTGRAF